MHEDRYVELIERYLSDQETTVRCFDINPLKQVIEITQGTLGTILHVNHYEDNQYYFGFKNIFLKHFLEGFIEGIEYYDYYICEEYPELAKDIYEYIRYRDFIPQTENVRYIIYVKDWWETHDEGNPVCFYEWQTNEAQEENLD